MVYASSQNDNGSEPLDGDASEASGQLSSVNLLMFYNMYCSFSTIKDLIDQACLTVLKAIIIFTLVIVKNADVVPCTEKFVCC